MLRALLRISSLIDSLSERVGGVSVLLVIVTVAVGFYNVLVRYLGQFIGMQLSSNLFIELQWYLYSLVFFLGFAYILKNGINVRVDFIYANWSKKRQALIDFWGHLLLARALLRHRHLGDRTSGDDFLATVGTVA